MHAYALETIVCRIVLDGENLLSYDLCCVATTKNVDFQMEIRLIIEFGSNNDEQTNIYMLFRNGFIVMNYHIKMAILLN